MLSCGREKSRSYSLNCCLQGEDVFSLLARLDGDGSWARCIDKIGVDFVHDFAVSVWVADFDFFLRGLFRLAVDDDMVFGNRFFSDTFEFVFELIVCERIEETQLRVGFCYPLRSEGNRVHAGSFLFYIHFFL